MSGALGNQLQLQDVYAGMPNSEHIPQRRRAVVEGFEIPSSAHKRDMVPRSAVTEMLLFATIGCSSKAQLELTSHLLDTAWEPGMLRPADEAIFEKNVLRWLQSGGNVLARCREMFDATLLHIAVNAGHANVVSLLLEHGADVNAAEGYGMTPIMCAAASSHRDNGRILQMLLDAGAEVNSRTTIQPYVKSTVVSDAEKSYDEARQTTLGSTALHIAAMDSRISVVKALLAAGASSLARDDAGRTAADYTRSEQVKAAILEHREKETSITDDICSATHAIYFDNSRPAKRWAREGKDIDARCSLEGDGDTLLIVAARMGDDDLVGWLLRHGAAVDGRSSKRDTALLATVRREGPESRMDTLRVLIKANADVNAWNKSGVTPLIAAAHKSLDGIIEELLLAGADASLRDRSGKTAHDHAVSEGHMETASLILTFDVSAYARDDHPDTIPFFVIDLYAIYGAIATIALGLLAWRSLRQTTTHGGRVCNPSGQRAALRARKKAKAAGAKNEKEDETLCKVCLERPKSPRALVPCGHICLCVECIEELQNLTVHFECPICRAAVDSVIIVRDVK